ncbi:MAG: hypothetical protein ACJA2F_001537, partial [Nitriliruptoraceae bacterium]
MSRVRYEQSWEVSVDFIIDFISGVGIVTAISLVLLIAWFV